MLPHSFCRFSKLFNSDIITQTFRGFIYITLLFNWHVTTGLIAHAVILNWCYLLVSWISALSLSLFYLYFIGFIFFHIFYLLLLISFHDWSLSYFIIKSQLTFSVFAYHDIVVSTLWCLWSFVFLPILYISLTLPINLLNIYLSDRVIYNTFVKLFKLKSPVYPFLSCISNSNCRLTFSVSIYPAIFIRSSSFKL